MAPIDSSLQNYEAPPLVGDKVSRRWIANSRLLGLSFPYHTAGNIRETEYPFRRGEGEEFPCIPQGEEYLAFEKVDFKSGCMESIHSEITPVHAERERFNVAEISFFNLRCISMNRK